MTSYEVYEKKVTQIIKSNQNELNLYQSQKLGAGAYGVVYDGKYKGAKVAVKKIHLDKLGEREKDREMLHFKLEHKNVVKIIAVIEDNVHAYR